MGMIKKVKLSLVLSTVALTIASAQPNQPWEDFTGETRLFDFGSAEITLVQGLAFQLVVDPGGNTDFAAMIAAGNAGTGWGIGAEDWMNSGSTADYNANDDVVIAGFNYWEALPDDGVGYLPALTTTVADGGNNYWSTRFYFRWFNSDDPATATEAGVIYNPTWQTVPNELIPPNEAVLTYGGAGNAGSELAGEGWQSMPMVPEPGTFVLFGIGLLTVAARRKLRKSA